MSSWLKAGFEGIWGQTVVPIGILQPDRLQAKRRAAKAVLVPSTWDVFNLGAAEAMADGKVTVISTGAGAADLIIDGQNGFTFENGEAEDLARVVRLVEELSESDLTGIGQAASETVRERLDPIGLATERIRSYRELQLQPRPDPRWLRESFVASSSDTPFVFLNGLPLRDLSLYVAERGVKKVLGRTVDA